MNHHLARAFSVEGWSFRNEVFGFRQLQNLTKPKCVHAVIGSMGSNNTSDNDHSKGSAWDSRMHGADHNIAAKMYVQGITQGLSSHIPYHNPGIYPMLI